MSLPATPKVLIRFGTGAGFGNVLVLGDTNDGVLGTNVLGTASALAVDISQYCNSINIRRGRDRVTDHYNNGTATITFIDQTGDFDPSNADGPYYGEILPMRQLRISATYSGTEYFLFTGFITSWDYDYQMGFDGAFVTVQAEDAFRLLNLAQIEDVPPSAPGDLPGTRINDLLDEAGWLSSLRQISEGDVQLLDDPWTVRPCLQALQTVEDTENGALYCDPTGNVVFKSRVDVATATVQTPTVFSDDGTEISYQGIDFSLDDAELANDVIVEAEGGFPQQVEDATSIETYFRRTLSRTGLMFYDDNDALGQAKRILNYRKDVKLRINSVTLDCSTDSNRVLPALTLDFNDPIQVNKTNPGSTAISALLTVQGISHDIRPGTWQTTFNTAFPLTSAFVLGSTEFGILGTSSL